MSSTIEYIRRLNRSALQLRSEWLSRLRLIADNPKADDSSELVFVEPVAATESMHPGKLPTVSVSSNPVNSPHFELAHPDFRAELPDSDGQSQVPQKPHEPRPKWTEEERLIPDGDPDEPANIAIAQIQRRAALHSYSATYLSHGGQDNKVRVDDAHTLVRKGAHASMSPTPASGRDIKRIVDQILKQYPPVSSSLLMFVSAEIDERHEETVRAIASELATRSNEQILLVDTHRGHGRRPEPGLAEMINHQETANVNFALSGIENLLLMGAGIGEITHRKTQPTALVRFANELKKQFKYTCIAAQEHDHLLTKLLARYCEACYFILDLSTTGEAVAKHQVDSLRNSGARFGGCIVRNQRL